jgi:hypothetical protein
MDPHEEPPVGQCCNCLRVTALRNMVMLHRLSPSPGKGWGCVVCGNPERSVALRKLMEARECAFRAKRFQNDYQQPRAGAG